MKKIFLGLIIFLGATSFCNIQREETREVKTEKIVKNRKLELFKGWGAKIFALTGVCFALADIVSVPALCFMLKENSQRMNGQGVQLNGRLTGLELVEESYTRRPFCEMPSKLFSTLTKLSASVGLIYASYKAALWGQKVLEDLSDEDEQ